MYISERVFPMNEFLPLYFYISLFTFSHERNLPFLLFASLFLDIIVYPFSFIHTLLTIVLYLLNTSWHIPHQLKLYLGRTCLNTFIYVGILLLIFQHLSPIFLLMSLLWNFFLTFLLFKKRSLNFSKR